MKKKWMAACGVTAFFLSAGIALWMEKPALTQMAGQAITTTANSKLNGTLSFSSLDISLKGQLVLAKPVIRDTQGRVVIEGDAVRVYVNPGKIVNALKQGEILQALDTADVDNPVLHLWQNEDDGTWNVASLIKKDQRQTDAGFRGAINVHNGTIDAVLPDSTAVMGQNVNGSVSFAGYPSMAIDASMTVDGQKVTAHGTYASNRQYDFTLSADAVNGTYASSFIPASADVVIRSGTVENVKVRVADSHNGFFLSGQADVTDGHVTVQGLDVDGLKGHAALTTQDITLSGVEGRVNGQDFRVGGTIVTNGDMPVFNLNVDVPGADVTAFADYLPTAVSGTAGFQGTVWGTPQDVSARGTASLHDVTYDGYTVDEVRADLAYSHDRVDIASLSAQAYGASLTGKGVYDVRSGAYEADVDVQGLDLSALPGVPAAVMGNLSASLHAAGNSQDGSIVATGQVKASNLSYNGLTVDTAAGDVAYDGRIVTLRSGHAEAGGASVDVSGSYDVDSQTPHLTFTGHDLPLDMASPFVSLPLSGTADLSGHVDGSQWDVAFSASQGQIKGVPFDSLDGTARGQGSRIEIPALYWRRGDGTHVLTGQADLDARTVQAVLTTSHMRIEQLLPAVGKEDLPLTGWADNTITLSGSLDNPTASGSFRLSRGSYAGYLYKNISADYRLDNGTVYLSNGDISSYTASLALSGSVGDTLDLDLTGRHVDIARLIPQNKTPRSGYFDIQAHIGGSLDNPTAAGSLKAANLVINHMVLNDIHGDFAYYDDLLRLTDLHFAQLGGVYDGNLLYNTQSSLLRGRATVVNGDIAGLLKVAALPVQDVAGKLNGQIDISGTSDNPTVSMKGNIRDGSFGGQPVEPADIDVQMENGVVHLNKAALHIGNSVLAAQGTYALHGPVKLSVAAKQFPAKALTDVLGQNGFVVDAPIDFAADLSGTGDDLQADVSAQLGSGTVNGISFTGAYALFNIRHGLITLHQASGSRDPYKVSASGTIPVSALKGGQTSESMDLDVRLDNAGLDILTFLTPYVTEASGPIQGGIKVSGTLDAPRVNGDIAIKMGRSASKIPSIPWRTSTLIWLLREIQPSSAAAGLWTKKGRRTPAVSASTARPPGAAAAWIRIPWLPTFPAFTWIALITKGP